MLKVLGRKKILIVVIACGVLAGLIGGFIVWKQLNQQPWPAPEIIAAQQSSSFKLYYPQSLPQGFHFQKGSLKQSSGVVIYELLFDGNKKLFISAVPKPRGVDFNDFYNRILSNESAVLSTQGKAVIGNAGGQTIGSLVSSSSWVTINTQASIASQTLQAILSSLKPI